MFTMGILPLLFFGQAADLNQRENEVIREIIYKSEPEFTSNEPPGGGAVLFMVAPKELKKIYGKDPAATINLLLSIAEGGNPRDSSLAVAYALTLIEGEGYSGFLVYKDLFKPKEYDKIRPHFDVTWRTHWIISIKKCASAKKIDLSQRNKKD